ncbi:MAG: choice-of-anchor Q domain-containing protein [Thermoleophilaceae bacterium]
MAIAGLLSAHAAAGTAAAPTIRYASPTGVSKLASCTAPDTPCSLGQALGAAQPGDTISLADGTYDTKGLVLPSLPLHWQPTDPQTRPVLISSGAAPTIDLIAAQSGTSFDHLEIDNTNKTSPSFQPALMLESGAAAEVRSSILVGRTCVYALLAGPLTIEDSTLTTTEPGVCLSLGAQSVVRRSVVGRAPAVQQGTATGLIGTEGLLEDSRVSGSVFLEAPTATVRRVTVSGPFGIAGSGLVADSLVRAFGAGQAAIGANSPVGETLRVVNSTAISTHGPALASVAVQVENPTEAPLPNDLVATNSIARGSIDVEANSAPACGKDEMCQPGRVEIDHSDFVTRVPGPGAPGAALVSEGAGNRNGDPLFVDPALDDYRLQAGSPALDAGVPSDLSLPTDLDGRPRFQGAAPDLGAYESPGAGGGPGGGAGPNGGPGTAHPAVIGGLRVSPRRFHRGGRATIAFRLDRAARVTLTFQRVLPAHGRGATLRKAGRLTIPHGRRGANTLRFRGRFGGRTLPRGRYRVSATPAGGSAQTARFTIL